jgi:hypothetical protein
VDEMVATAASVHQTDAGGWQVQKDKLNGGPGLVPDPDAVELDRGEAGGHKWLLQARHGAENPMGTTGYGGTTLDPDPADRPLTVDLCLKLLDGGRACPESGSGGGDANFTSVNVHVAGQQGPGGPNPLPGFVVVQTPSQAERVRVTTDKGSADSELHDVGNGKRAAVVFVDGVGFPSCQTTPPPPGFAVSRVELIDSSGNAMCVG